ncbi:MAG: hypothetical protein ACFE8V_11695 [Promethearchaeota archaeon]
MRKQNENIEDKDKKESPPVNDYIQLYAQIVRELNKDLINRKESGEDVLCKKIDLYKTLSTKKRIEPQKDQKKLLKYINLLY